nr:hypothetical protein [Tanacetum cinerariifolium]
HGSKQRRSSSKVDRLPGKYVSGKRGRWKNIFRKICNWWDVSNMKIVSFDD